MSCSGKQGRCQSWNLYKEKDGKGKEVPFFGRRHGCFLQSFVKAVSEDDGKSVRMSTVFCHYNDKKILKSQKDVSAVHVRGPGDKVAAYHSLNSSLSIYKCL